MIINIYSNNDRNLLLPSNSRTFYTLSYSLNVLCLPHKPNVKMLIPDMMAYHSRLMVLGLWEVYESWGYSSLNRISELISPDRSLALFTIWSYNQKPATWRKALTRPCWELTLNFQLPNCEKSISAVCKPLSLWCFVIPVQMDKGAFDTIYVLYYAFFHKFIWPRWNETIKEKFFQKHLFSFYLAWKICI